jgi:hypothetical protein
MSTDRAARARAARHAESSAAAIQRRSRAVEHYHASKTPLPPKIQETIGEALAAPTFDPATVAALATRVNFPPAVRWLTQFCKWRGLGSPVAALWCAGDSDNVASHRLALGLNLFVVGPSDGVQHDRAWLRSVDNEAARVALAMLGESQWETASPRERAGYLLAHVVAAWRRQAA